MSVLSNFASATPEQGRAYVDAVLALLGDREPLDVLASTAAAMADALAGLSAEQRRTPEREGKWSAAQLMQHLADSEIVWGYRLRRALAEDSPPLDGFDQDVWADRLAYRDADADQALAVFRTLREENLRLLARMPREALERVGVHAERGPESVAYMMRLYAGHDLAHRRQMERIGAAVRGGPE